MSDRVTEIISDDSVTAKQRPMLLRADFTTTEIDRLFKKTASVIINVVLANHGIRLNAVQLQVLRNKGRNPSPSDSARDRLLQATRQVSIDREKIDSLIHETQLVALRSEWGYRDKLYGMPRCTDLAENAEVLAFYCSRLDRPRWQTLCKLICLAHYDADILVRMHRILAETPEDVMQSLRDRGFDPTVGRDQCVFLASAGKYEEILGIGQPVPNPSSQNSASAAKEVMYSTTPEEWNGKWYWYDASLEYYTKKSRPTSHILGKHELPIPAGGYETEEDALWDLQLYLDCHSDFSTFDYMSPPEQK
jgi:hypothetical protein